MQQALAHARSEFQTAQYVTDVLSTLSLPRAKIQRKCARNEPVFGHVPAISREDALRASAMRMLRDRLGGLYDLLTSTVYRDGHPTQVIDCFVVRGSDPDQATTPLPPNSTLRAFTVGDMRIPCTRELLRWLSDMGVSMIRRDLQTCMRHFGMLRLCASVTRPLPVPWWATTIEMASREGIAHDEILQKWAKTTLDARDGDAPRLFLEQLGMEFGAK